MSAGYARLLLRLRWPILLLWGLLLAGSAALYLERFRIDNSVGIWFLDDDPDLGHYQSFTEAFGGTEWIFAVVQTSSIGSSAFLAGLGQAVEEISARPDVERVLSLLTAHAAPIPEFRHLFLRPGDDRRTAMLIETAPHALAAEAAWEDTVAGIRSILGRAEGIEAFWLAGTPVINAELNRAARRDMLVFYCVLAVLLAAFGRIFLGHMRDLFVLLAMVSGSVLPTLGLVGGLSMSFNMVTVMLPTILVSMSASIAIHMINEFHTLHARMPPLEAIGHAASALVRPAFWTTATTAVAFLSLLASGVEPLRQVGWLAASGIVLGFLNAFVIAPLFLYALWHVQPARPVARAGRWVDRVIERISGATAHRWWVIACAVPVFAVCLSGLPRLHADTDYVNFFRDGRQMNADYRAITDAGFPQYSLDLELRLPAERPAAAVADRAVLGGLSRAIEALPRIHAVVGPVQVSGGRMRFAVFGDHHSSRELDDLRRRVEALAGDILPPGSETTILGTSVLWANMDMSVVDTQATSLAVMIVALLLLMPVLAGSIRVGLIGLGVSVLPVLSILGLMGWAGLTVNVATCLIGGVAIGVAVDDTIFMLMRTRGQLRSRKDLGEAVRQSQLTTGRAMIATSAIMSVCFLSMVLSDFQPTAQFGWLFALAILSSLAADLLLLPALLLVCGWQGPSADGR